MNIGCTTCGFVVEWVRVSKRSKWRLIRGHPELLTAGRYVYAPAGTPHYPLWHNFGSRNWTSDERDPWPALGEWEGANQVDLGGLATAYPAARLIGDPQCIEQGERFPLPIIPDYSLVGGFDSRCFRQSGLPPIPRRVDTTDRAWQRQFALLQDLLYDNPLAAKIVAQNLFGPLASVTVVPDSDSFVPGSLIIVLPEQTIVIVSGTTTETQTALQILYQANGLQNIGPFDTNGIWWTAANYLFTRVNLAGADPTKPITLVGHSYGGAIATIMAATYHRAQPDRDIQLLTFGMPKPGGQRLHDILADLTQTHLVNDGDPIPALPTVAALLVPVNVAAPAWLQLQWPTFIRPDGQITLAANGTQTVSQGDSILFSTVIQMVSDAVLGNPFTVGQPHEIKEYLFRLSLTPP